MGLFSSFKSKKSRSYGEVVIQYDTLPPNFRQADNTPIPINVCGTCKFRGNGKKGMICTKYDVEFYGVGCGVATICDDFKNGLFN